MAARGPKRGVGARNPQRPLTLGVSRMRHMELAQDHRLTPHAGETASIGFSHRCVLMPVLRENLIHNFLRRPRMPWAGRKPIGPISSGSTADRERHLMRCRNQNPTRGRDQEWPSPIGPASTSALQPELCGESVVVVEATEDWVCHDLDGTFPGLLRRYCQLELVLARLGVGPT